MTQEEFNRKYYNLGGTKELQEMMNDLCTLERIAIYFNVSKERVRQWSYELFGKRYDPRYERKKKKYGK